ncbi:MAG: hypothetical protein Q9217_006797 [Psora testacea]
MEGVEANVLRLSSQISALGAILDDLKKQLAEAERSTPPQSNEAPATKTRSSGQLNRVKTGWNSDRTNSHDSEHFSSSSSAQQWPMPLDDYKRYGRQMILPKIGLKGQLRLKSARVLIIGLGGLGCPAAMYLAGAGVGTIGVMDGDEVEPSNLHRQVLHSTDQVGWSKTTSAVKALKGINPTLTYRSYPYPFTPLIALKTIEEDYDLILDCTDHPTSRYLISDAAVLAGKPLISASALKCEGQLLVLNSPVIGRTEDYADRGHCYRCVFPRPPPPESVESCGEGGILGPVVGVMGTLMATEAIKVLTANETPSPVPRTMLLYSAYSDTPFRTVRLAGKRPDCPSCSQRPTISKQSIIEGSTDYVAFCGFRQPHIQSPITRMSLDDFQHCRPTKEKPHQPILIDVRNETEFSICHLPYAINIPLASIQQNPQILRSWLLKSYAKKDPTIFICRYGNDSQEAVRIGQTLCKDCQDLGLAVELQDVRGGLKAWKDEIDPNFPEY